MRQCHYLFFKAMLAAIFLYLSNREFLGRTIEDCLIKRMFPIAANHRTPLAAPIATDVCPEVVIVIEKIIFC
jgi:hypothetical protein